MSTMSFGTKLRNLYKRLQTPLAYIIVIIAASFSFSPWPKVSSGMLVAFAFLILPLFFEIHKTVVSDSPVTSFNSFAEARPIILSVLDTHILQDRDPKVRLLGSALYYQFPILEEFISNNILKANPGQLSVEIALMDPDWTDTSAADDALPGQIISTAGQIKKFVKNHSTLIEKHKWSIRLFQYQYLPQRLGILIGNNDLFLCRTYWKKGSFYGGANSVEHLNSNDSALATKKISEFKSWFNYLKQSEIDII